MGGETSELDKVRPVLKAMGRDIVHLGPTGTGAIMKLVNNILCGVQTASMGECLAFAEKQGLDTEKVLSLLLNGAPGSPLVKTVASRMFSRGYSVNFSLRLMEKDLRYGLSEAKQKGTSLRMAEAAWELFRGAVEKGLGGQDFSAVIESLRSGE